MVIFEKLPLVHGAALVKLGSFETFTASRAKVSSIVFQKLGQY